MTNAEKRTGSRTREIYALADSCKAFEFYLIGTPFVAITDHLSVKWLLSSYKSNNLSARLLNILAYLYKFDITISHMKNTSPEIVASDVLTKNYTLDELTNNVEESQIPDVINCLLISPLVYNHNNDGRKKYCLRENVRNVDSGVTEVGQFTPKADIAFQFSDTVFKKAEFIKLQNEDSFCQKIIDILKNKPKNAKFCRSTRKKFVLKNDLLFAKKFNCEILVLPTKIAFDFISFYHNLQVHPGAKALESMLRGTVHVHGLQAITQKVCSECENCIRNKPRKKLRPQKVINRSFSSYPFQRAYIDLVQMKKDNNGKSYLLTLTDELSMYIDGEPLSSKKDHIVGEGLLRLILRNACFGTLVHDRGCEFIGEIVKNINKKLNIKTIRTSAYNSQSNLGERNHREYWCKFRLLKVDMKTWSSKWPLIKFHLNNLPRARLDNLSPYEVLFGRPMFLPYTADENIVPNTHHSWTKHASRYFSELYPSILRFQRERYSKTIDRDKGVNINLEIGSFVLFYKPTLFNAKHVSCWSGPCKVTKQLSKNTYEISDQFGRTYVRHLRNLRRCTYEINDPNLKKISVENSDSKNHSEIEESEDENNISFIFGRD